MPTEILTDPFGWDRNEAQYVNHGTKWIPLHFDLDFSEFSQGTPRLWTLTVHGPATVKEVEAAGDWYSWLESLTYPPEADMTFDGDGDYLKGFRMFGTNCALRYRRGRGKRSTYTSPKPEPVGAT